jgi:hypothetical protein
MRRISCRRRSRAATAFPHLTLHLRETIPIRWCGVVSGDLDVILVALDRSGAGGRDASSFDDKFVLAARATKGKRPKATDYVAHEQLLLLEEGHCLRDQALSFAAVTPEHASFGPRASPPSCRWLPWLWDNPPAGDGGGERVHRRHRHPPHAFRGAEPAARSGLLGARPLRARQTFMPCDAAQDVTRRTKI